MPQKFQSEGKKQALLVKVVEKMLLKNCIQQNVVLTGIWGRIMRVFEKKWDKISRIEKKFKKIELGQAIDQF